MVKSHVEESLGANPGDAALNPADSVAMGVPSSRAPRFLHSSKGRAFRALVHRPYRLLFTAFLINQTGFWISHISLQGQMVALSQNDPFMLGLLFFALFVPAFLLAPLAGVAADRFDRKRIMIACYAGVATLMATFIGLTVSQTITPTLMLGAGFLLGTCFAFSGPASFAVAANTVPDADLPSAVSLQSAANNLTRVVGPALAAPVLASGRFEIAFCFFFVAALVAAFLTGRMQIASYAPDTDEGGIFARLHVGFAHARERRPALPAIGVVAALSLFGVSHAALLPVYAEVILGDRAYFAWIVATTGAGATLGAIVTGYQAAASLRGAALRLLLYAASLGLFASTENLWIALGAQVAIGYFYFSVMTSLQTLVQQIVAESRRGRVMSLFQVAWAGLVPFGGLGMGVVAELSGVIVALGVGAAACAVVAAVVLLRAEHWSRPSLAG
jgi:MFS family permease